MARGKRRQSETLDAQDEKEELEAELDDLLSSPEKKKRGNDEEDDDSGDDEEEDEELKRARRREAKLKKEMEREERELAEKLSKQTLWSELKAMIPGTKEYLEEQEELRQMFEDESIARIKRELAKCAAIDRILQKGEWEKALARLKRDLKFEEYTDFQRVKHDMEEKGEWDPTAEVKYKPPPKPKGIIVAMLTTALTRLIGTNEDEDEDEDEEGEEEGGEKKGEQKEGEQKEEEVTEVPLQVIQVAKEGEEEHFTLLVDKAEANLICTWRVKGPEDRYYRCTNPKVMHIKLTRIDIYGRTRPVFQAHCKYHLKTCYNDHGMHFVRVAESNDLGLCNECYVRARDHPPSKLDPFTVPGVSREPRKRAQAEDQKKDDEEDEEDPRAKFRVCKWQADRHKASEAKWVCTNKVFKNPLTRRHENYCAYHMPRCWQPHADAADPTKTMISTPNVDGLCVSHFLALHHRNPPVLPFPYPGMIQRKKRSHPMGPIDAPTEHIIYPFYDDQGDSDYKMRVGGLIKALGSTFKHAANPASALKSMKSGLHDLIQKQRSSNTNKGPRRRKKKASMMPSIRKMLISSSPSKSTSASGKQAERVWTAKEKQAILVFQKDFRMMLAQLLRKKLADRRQARRRIAATLQLQAWARARIQRGRFLVEVKAANTYISRVQALFRGFMVRKYLKLRRAARVITRALARNYGSVLHMSYQILQQERWAERNWSLACTTLQRVIRGFFARREAARIRDAIALRLRRVTKVQSCGRRFLAQLRARQLKEERDKLWNSALIIQSLMKLARFRRRAHARAKLKKKAAEVIQLQSRLYLAHLRARRERLKQQEMWDLWNPKYMTKADVLPLLKRSTYGVVVQPTTLAIKQDSFFGALTKQDGVDEAVVRLMLSVDSCDTMSLLSASQSSLDNSFEYKELFKQYDTASLGIISKEEFLKALTSMWELTGNDLQADEARALVDLFDVEKDGRIRYRLFYFYALKHTRPCFDHGRYICGECYYLSECNKHIDPLTRCKCRKYSLGKDTSSANRGLCTCGHSISTHQIVPLVFKEEMEVTKIPITSERQLMVSLRRGRRVADCSSALVDMKVKVLCMPNALKGRKLRPEDLDILRKRRLEKARRARTPWRLEKYDEWAVRMLAEDECRPTTASSFFRGRDLDDLWPEVQRESLYITRPGVNAEVSIMPISINSRRPETPRGEGLTPHTQLLPYVISVRTMREEVRKILGEGKLPVRQSHKELKYGFAITVPLPVVARQELRACTSPVALYLHLLHLFSDTFSSLLDDQRAYTHVIAHHCVFIERHWKKFIQDIRSGTLNEFMPLKAEQRWALESRMIPDPKMAAKLERVFYSLGFHRRASGRAVNSSKNKSADKTMTIAKTRRKRGSGTGGHAGGAKGRHDSMALLPSPSKTYLFPEYASPFRYVVTHAAASVFPPSQPEGEGEEGSSSYHAVSRPQSARTAAVPETHGSRSPGAKGSHVTAEHTEGDDSHSTGTRSIGSKAKGIVRYKPLKRSGSVQDIDRVKLPNREIFRLGYEMARQPFPVDDPIHLQDQRWRRRYVCGHPGCGKAFTNEEIAKEHLRTHDFCTRLGVAVPLTDQYLNKYWPAQSPWKTKDMITKSKPVALYYCPFAPCPRNFGDLALFEQHLRCGHTKHDLQRLGIPSISGVEWTGSTRLVPPLELPPRAGVPICTNSSHTHPRFRCPMCRANQVFPGPKAPLRFHDKGRVPLPDGSKITISFVDPESTVCIVEEEADSVTGSLSYSRSSNSTSSNSGSGSPKQGSGTGSSSSSSSLKGHMQQARGKKSVIGGSHTPRTRQQQQEQPLITVHCVGLCEDRTGQAWFGAARYLDSNTVRQRFGAKRLPSDFDRENEVVQSLEVEWMPISRIKAYSYTLCCTRAEFKQRKIEGSLPKGAPVKFCRYVFSTDQKQVVGHRTIMGDPYKTSGVIFGPPGSFISGTNSTSSSGNGSYQKALKPSLSHSLSSVSESAALPPFNSQQEV